MLARLPYFKQISVVLMCMLFNMVDGFDITAMAVTINAIGNELDIGADKQGLIFSFTLAGMMLGAMFLAPVSDLIGRRKTIIAALALVGSTVILTAQANGLSAIIALRFISGLGAGALMATQAALASEYASEKYRALAVTAVTAGYPLGAMMTGIIAQQVMPEFGWRGLFVGGGAVTFLMVLVALLWLPESMQYLSKKQPANALERINNIRQQMGQEVLTELPPIEPKVAASGFKGNLLSLLQGQYLKPTLMLWTVFFLCFLTLYFLMSWIPKLMLLSGFDQATAFRAFTLFNLGGVIGIFSLGYLASRFNLTYLVTAFLLLSATTMLLTTQLTDMQTALLSVIFITGILQQGGFTGLYAAASKIYAVEVRSTGIGWAIGLGRFGAVVGPAIAGYLIAAGVSAQGNFVIFAIPLILGGVLAFQLRVR